MSETTILSERDKLLVSIGKWPIDVDEARPLNATEIDELRASRAARNETLADWLDPWVRNGWLEFRKK